MKTLEKGADSIKHICEVLRQESLEPAELEAAKILQEAGAEAATIIDVAEKKAAEIVEKARADAERQKSVFESSVKQALEQALEQLRQSVQAELFNEGVVAAVEEGSKDPKLVAGIIDALVDVVKKDGVEGDLSAIIGKKASAEEVSKAITEGSLKRLGDSGITLGGFSGGAKLRIHGKNLVLDLSSEALTELFVRYLGRGFRDLLFKQA